MDERSTIQLSEADPALIHVLNKISTKSKILMKFEKHPDVSTGAILKFGSKVYEGKARNIKESRMEAAQKALKDFNGGKLELETTKFHSRSPISALNDLRQRLKVNLSFEFSERRDGPSKIYSCTATFGEFVAHATGYNKQNCKFECAESILKHLNKESNETIKPIPAKVPHATYEPSPIFLARDYQEEIYNKGVRSNIIACLGTGCGKTFIAVLLIKKFSNETFGTFPQAKRIVFLVPTVALMFQQSEYIRRHTNLNVGYYCGDMASPIESSEFWESEIAKNNVLVLTAELFRQLLQYAVIDISNLCLLVFDECHHGFNPGHPYNVIMTLYYSSKRVSAENVPRIIGLTASPALNADFNNFATLELKQKIEKLEQIFDSQCITSVEYLDSLKSIYSNPEINMIQYREETGFESMIDIINCITGCKDAMMKYFDESCINIFGSDDFSFTIEDCDDLGSKLNDQIVTSKKIKKCLKRCFDRCMKTIENLGIYSLGVILKNMIKVNQRLTTHKSFEKCRDIFIQLKKYLVSIQEVVLVHIENILHSLSDKSFHSLASTALFTNKLQRLILILCDHYISSHLETISPAEKCSTLLFVAERSTCAVIAGTINELAEIESKYLKCKPRVVADYVTGATVSSIHKKLPDGIMDSSIKTNNLRLESFHQNIVNVLVATNVLEEGIDVHSCNVVVRFDRFSTLRSFIQSKGRVRQKDASFYVLVNEKYKCAVEKHISNLSNAENCVENILTKYCLEEIEYVPEFNYFEELHPEERSFITSKTQMDLRASVSFLYQFCDRYSRESAYTVKPKFYMQTIGDKFRWSVRLPSECCAAEEISSEWLSDKKLSRQHCALRAIKMLYNYGKIDENLLPVNRSQKFNILEKVSKNGQTNEDPDDVVLTSNIGTPLSNFYEKSIPMSLKSGENQYHFYCYQVYLSEYHSCKSKEHIFSTLDLSKRYIGLLIPCQINSVSFPLASSQHSLQIHIKPHSSFSRVILNYQQSEKIKEFNQILYEKCLKIVPKNCIWAPEMSHYCVYTVVFDQNDTVDFDLMGRLVEFSSMSREERSKLPIVSTLTPPYNDMLVCKNYSDDYMIYHVIRAGEVNPKDTIENTPRTFAQYFKTKWSKELSDDEIMLSCYLCNLNINFLGNLLKLKTKHSKLLYLPASGVVGHPLSFSTIFQLSLVPSIIKRLVDFLVIEEWCQDKVDVCGIEQVNYRAIDSFVHQRQECHASNEPEKIHFEGNEDMFEEYYLTLSLYWNNSAVSSQKILFQSVFQAFTRVTSNECCNYERMELLGDSFLKFIVSMVLFVSYPSDNEGSMTAKRNPMVSNEFFTRLGKQLQVEKVMNTKSINFGTNWCPPGFFVENDNFDGPHRDVILYQYIPEKSIADVVEALVGCFLISSNISRVYEFLLKLNILKNDDISKKLSTISQLLKGFEDLMFDYPDIESIMNDICSVENIIKYNFTNKNIVAQALTHISSINEQTQMSYERLEFLGDAIVGFIIVLYLYLSHDQWSTKCLSPHIITHLQHALVNNKILGIISAKNSLLKCIQLRSFHLHQALSHFMNCVENLEELSEIQEVPFLGLIKTLSTNQDGADICPTIEAIPIPKPAGDLLESVLTAKIFMPFFKPYIRRILNMIVEKYLTTFPIQPKVHFMHHFSHYERNLIKMENREFKHIIIDPNTSRQYVGIGLNQEDAINASTYSFMKYRQEQTDQLVKCVIDENI
ncbi:Endoribonuclease dcr-1 [Thelohanellus kitauei]|uniref:Endoribonuclease dcr-1 n=1 Tax=Thelohanellus kitauei TaxID=669202 RepID=A0A0C2M8E2_THEKT|nr:Endoribonuclease dcr-1 [Thelohanellus kitauei]